MFPWLFRNHHLYGVSNTAFVLFPLHSLPLMSRNCPRV